MKKTYIQPQVEVTECTPVSVIAASTLTMGNDILNGNVPADAPEQHGWFDFE